MNESLQQLMRDAARLTQLGRLEEATATIQRALRGNSTMPPVALSGSPKPESTNDPKVGSVTLEAMATEPGGNVFAVKPLDDETGEPEFAAANGSHGEHSPRVADEAHQETHTDFREKPDPGSFTSGKHSFAAKTLDYKLYSPPGQPGRSLPLIVMLHGCTQDPDDFAAGTGMNEAAHAQGFFVLYPAQSQAANASRCWNWFQPNDQNRGKGEPALIASLTAAVVKQQDIDPKRVYIAGLSAGGAMATIVAEAYPEIFAAVGVHSGLPRGAAGNVMEALAIMKTGDSRGVAPSASGQQDEHVPTIVFHGSGDKTVHPRNGEQVLQAALVRAESRSRDASAPVASRQVERGTVPQGRGYTRSTYRDAQGNVFAEYWVVDGGGHAWSGGDGKGSYTDASGPDATHEMLRFFFEQVPADGI